MPRFVAHVAPKCARCDTSVFLAEQVIGPASKPYHKTCLTCVVCNKRLDSTLLVEHDGDPYCKNCHREHLGTGKGGFSKAVALNPTSPKSPRSPTTTLPNTTRSPMGTPSRTGAQMQYSTPETTLQRGMRETANRSPSPTKYIPAEHPQEDDLASSMGINIRARGLPASPLATSSPSGTNTSEYRGSDRSSYPSNSQTAIRSIDEAMSGGSDQIRDPVARLQAAVGGMSINNQTTAPTAASPAANPPNVSRGDVRNDFDITTPPPPTSRLQYSSPPSASQYSTETSVGEDGTPITMQTRRIAASDSIGSIRLGNTTAVNSQSPTSAVGQLPPARRPDSKTLTGASCTAKIAPPRSSIHNSPSSTEDPMSARRRSGIDRGGLSSSIVDASGGTPLCARCLKPVYFAEQKAAAGRKWHRACLRCDGCSSTLESGKMEEGPVSLSAYSAPQDGANVWCRICYAKYFGPKNLAVGLSLPETMR